MARITSAQRKWLAAQLLRSQKMGNAYITRIARKRNKVVQKAISEITAENYAEVIEDMSESYLKAEIYKLHTAVAYDAGEAQLKQFNSIKSDTYTWKQEINKWAKRMGGERIVSMTDALKTEMMLWAKTSLQGASGLGVEKQTKEIRKEVSKRWSSVKLWQVRRIVHTESLAAASVGHYQSIKSTGIKTVKTWSTTGNNTREQHLQMEGVEVDDDKLFTLPNGDQMLYPRDMEHGASAENIINCACGVIYSIKK
ncbi:MAG: hypothetical protein R3Y39_08995 [Rikenellaceae bacterium]